MPRLKKVPCAHCDAKMAAETSFCPNCEQPTIWASHEERTEWELRQWSKKRSSRPKRRASTAVEEVTPILSRRAAAPAPARAKPVVKHPAAHSVAKAAPVVSPPKERPARSAKPVPVRGTPPAAPQKKSVARSEPEPARAPARKTARKTVSHKVPAASVAPAAPPAPPAPAAPVVMEPVVIDLTEAPPATPDHGAEQTELLRKLLQHVISIEEKINGNGQRRLRLLKR